MLCVYDLNITVSYKLKKNKKNKNLGTDIQYFHKW